MTKTRKQQEQEQQEPKKRRLMKKSQKMKFRSSESRQQRSVQRCMLQRRNHCFHPRLTNYINANCLSLASVFVDLGFTHDRDDCELPDPWDAKSFGGKTEH